MKKLKTINYLLYITGLTSLLLFMMSHYMWIKIFDFHPRAYYIFIVIFMIAMTISSAIDWKVQKLKGNNPKWYSLLFDAAVYGLILAYAIYLWTIPIGTCPIKTLFTNHNYTQQEIIR